MCMRSTCNFNLYNTIMQQICHKLIITLFISQRTLHNLYKNSAAIKFTLIAQQKRQFNE